MSSKWKALLPKLYDVLDRVENLSGLDMSKFHLRDAFRLEVCTFLLYLSAGDGRLTATERDYINDLLDYNYSLDAYADFVKQNHIYSEEFEQKVPVTLQITGNVDQKVKQVDPSIPPFVPTIIDFLESVGAEFVCCDGELARQEKMDYHIYISNLRSKCM